MSSRIRFVLFLTNGDGSVVLIVVISKIACCIQYGITPETTYRLQQLCWKLLCRPRLARIILRTDFNSPSQEMFQELGWSPVPNRIK